MRKFLLTAALAQCAALALLLAACKAPDGADAGRGGAATTANAPAANTPGPAQTAQAPADIVRRVTAAELKGMLDKGQAVVVDVRTKPDFDREHIKGARSIPLGETAARASELPKDKLIVYYCA